MKVQVSGWSESLNLSSQERDADVVEAFIVTAGVKIPTAVKYVIFDKVFPVVFGGGIAHNEITIAGKKPTSAGFISISEDGDGVPR